jgi:hypothetical protein
MKTLTLPDHPTMTRCAFCQETSPDLWFDRLGCERMCADCFEFIDRRCSYNINTVDKRIEFISCLLLDAVPKLYYVHFYYGEKITVIFEGYRAILQLPLLPLGEKSMENIKNKLPLWLTFS